MTYHSAPAPDDYAYLARGAFSSLAEAVQYRHLTNLDWCEGEIGFIQYVLEFMLPIHEQFEQLQKLTDNGYQDMYNYVHLEVLGSWITEFMLANVRKPTVAEVMRKARQQYFLHCDIEESDREELRIEELRSSKHYRVLHSSHGQIHVDARTGEVIDIDLAPDAEDSFSDIIAFDPRDMVNTEQELDILDVGFWDHNRKYTHKRAYMGEIQR